MIIFSSIYLNSEIPKFYHEVNDAITLMAKGIIFLLYEQEYSES